jgi:hypothetical protein
MVDQVVMLTTFFVAAGLVRLISINGRTSRLPLPNLTAWTADVSSGLEVENNKDKITLRLEPPATPRTRQRVGERYGEGHLPRREMASELGGAVGI